MWHSWEVSAKRTWTPVRPNEKVDAPPLLFVFELDGKTPMPAAAAPPPPVWRASTSAAD